MIDKNGRLFGKISIIDLLIVVVILAILAGAYMILFGGSSPIEIAAEGTTIRYQVEMQHETETFSKQPSIGGSVFNSSKNYGIGSLVDIEIYEAMDTVENVMTGTFDRVSMPGFYDVILTIEAQAVVTDSTIKIGQQEVRIGEKIPVKGKGFADYGYVVGLQILE